MANNGQLFIRRFSQLIFLPPSTTTYLLTPTTTTETRYRSNTQSNTDNNHRPAAHHGVVDGGDRAPQEDQVEIRQGHREAQQAEASSTRLDHIFSFQTR
jgi:hypothetical protein